VRHTGDAQVGLASAVHDARLCSATSGRGCGMERGRATEVEGRLSELAVVRGLFSGAGFGW
jgi:hypothetical protein